MWVLFDLTSEIGFALSENSDQFGHLLSLINILSVYLMNIRWPFKLVTSVSNFAKNFWSTL